jgi:D-3-phosphoglycerate dehydrogenase
MMMGFPGPFNSKDIKILLLEGVSPKGVQILENAGYKVEYHTKALDESVLMEKIKDVSVIGIRSKTQLTANVLKEAKNLLVIGCFCIGTNQVDLEFAAKRGVTGNFNRLIIVFNSPFSNSRSVAELMIAEIVALSRELGDRNNMLHQDNWTKSSFECHEIRGKTLGIVGYGHIGSQLSVLAESMGMIVVFYDILQIMPLGTAKPLGSLQELLETSDFVTLHVPETDETKNMITSKELGIMKKGSFLINASRGSVVDIPALVQALKSEHLSGAAVDVYPSEPLKNGPGFTTELQNCPNTILTAHIGGSTEEAQWSIGSEVGMLIQKYIEYGTTLGSVNFPEIDIRIPQPGSKTVRLLNIHLNVPGVLKQINKVLSEYNIEKQICDSKGTIAYVMADINADEGGSLEHIYSSISSIPGKIKIYIIY